LPTSAYANCCHHKQTRSTVDSKVLTVVLEKIVASKAILEEVKGTVKHIFRGVGFCKGASPSSSASKKEKRGHTVLKEVEVST